MRIGVLASQGAFAEHIAVLRQLEVDTMPVRLPYQLEGLDGLIIPGGESTSISKLMIDYNLMDEIKSLAQNGLPILGTCAGMVLLAKETSDSDSKTLGLMDIKVRRNAFGRQKDSFETELSIPVLGDKPFPAVFIRAPIIRELGANVDILCQFNNHVVAVRQGNTLACTFHPELTEDTRFHSYFVDVVREGVVAESSC